jgi:flagellar motor switch protein FliG
VYIKVKFDNKVLGLVRKRLFLIKDVLFFDYKVIQSDLRLITNQCQSKNTK